MKIYFSCKSSYDYDFGNGLFTCPECSLEWNPEEQKAENQLIVKDANGNVLKMEIRWR